MHAEGASKLRLDGSCGIMPVERVNSDDQKVLSKPIYVAQFFRRNLSCNRLIKPLF